MKSKPKIFNPTDPVEVKFVATIYNILTKGFEMSSIYRCGNCDYILHASKTNRPKVCLNCVPPSKLQPLEIDIQKK